MVELSPEQGHVMRQLRDNMGKQQVQTVGGYAGTGKTLLLAHLMREYPNYAVVAFTGRAASVLKGRGVEKAATIHSTIYKLERDDRNRVVEPPTFVLKEEHELGCDGFFVDEASMVGDDIQRDLASFELPIVYFGDHGQLPPVGDADADLMANPMYRLETIHRNAGEIARFAAHLRLGHHARAFKTDGQVRVIGGRELNGRLLLEPDQTICAFNRTRVELNRQVRAALGFDGGVQVEEKVLCLRNSRVHRVFNGMQGYVTAVSGRLLSFESDGASFTNVPYDAEQFGKERLDGNRNPEDPIPFDYGYVVTCHKAQGGEWGQVLVVEQVCKMWEHSRWAYTAASRARELLTWVAA